MSETTSPARKTLRFTTRQFERTHGRKPKGFGNWAFQQVTAETAFDHERVGRVEFFTGTLTEAKAKAKAEGMGELTGLVAVLG